MYKLFTVLHLNIHYTAILYNVRTYMYGHIHHGVLRGYVFVEFPNCPSHNWGQCSNSLLVDNGDLVLKWWSRQEWVWWDCDTVRSKVYNHWICLRYCGHVTKLLEVNTPTECLSLCTVCVHVSGNVIPVCSPSWSTGKTSSWNMILYFWVAITVSEMNPSYSLSSPACTYLFTNLFNSGSCRYS
jgi:hypothetical protein